MLSVPLAMLVVLLIVVDVSALPFKNPITPNMMKMNDGPAVRAIMEDLDSRGEVS